MYLLNIDNGLITVQFSAEEASLLRQACRLVSSANAGQAEPLQTIAGTLDMAGTVARFQSPMPPNHIQRVRRCVQNGTNNHNHPA